MISSWDLKMDTTEMSENNAKFAVQYTITTVEIYE